MSDLGNMNDCVGLNFLDMKDELLKMDLIDADTELYEICEVIQAESSKDESGTKVGKEFMYRAGYVMGAADVFDCTFSETIDNVDFSTAGLLARAMNLEAKRDPKQRTKTD